MEETVGEGAEMEAPVYTTVAVAVSGSRSRSSRHALEWALDKFVAEGRVLFRILHVRPTITMVPTPMGNFIPISQVREDVASAYRKEAEWQASNTLLPYKTMCTQRKVEAEAVLLESDDVAAAIFQMCTGYIFKEEEEEKEEDEMLILELGIWVLPLTLLLAPARRMVRLVYELQRVFFLAVACRRVPPPTLADVLRRLDRLDSATVIP